MSAKIIKLRVIIGAGVVIVAGASGYFMQNTLAPNAQPIAAIASPQQPVAVEDAITTQNIAGVEDPAVYAPVAPTQPMIETVTRAATPSALALPTAAPSLLEAPSFETLTLGSTETDPTLPPALSSEDTILVSDCEAGFTAMAAPGAMVELTLEAPCYAGEMVDIFHAGMRFSEYLDANGLLQLSIPVMEEDAFFNALFIDGHTESTDILMLTVNDYYRVALFWKGEAGFSLYALENGALYGEADHVGDLTPYSSDRGISGQGGYLAQLGQNATGYHSAIYSYPVMLTDTGPYPEVSIEVDVTAENCASEISATLMRVSSAGALESSPLIMAVPECGAIGEYLVLKNLPRDLRIATN